MKAEELKKSQLQIEGALSQGKFYGFDAIFTELRANPGEQHGFHLFKVETHGGLGDAEDEMAVFHRDGLGVAGNKIPGQFFPRQAHLIFVQSVLRSGRTKNGGNEFFRQVDPLVQVSRFLAAAPFAENFFADCSRARFAFYHG